MAKEEINIGLNGVYADIAKIDIEQFKAIFSKGGGALGIYRGNDIKEGICANSDVKSEFISI